jgi:hypothetical protein
VQSCLAALAPKQPTDWADLESRARTALAAKPPPRETDAIEALTEQRLAIVDELWRLRVSQCGTTDGPLAWVADHLGR